MGPPQRWDFLGGSQGRYELIVGGEIWRVCLWLCRTDVSPGRVHGALCVCFGRCSKGLTSWSPVFTLMPQLEMAATRGLGEGACPYRPLTLPSPAPSSSVFSGLSGSLKRLLHPPWSQDASLGWEAEYGPFHAGGWFFRVQPSCWLSDPSHVQAQGQVPSPT